MSDSVRKWSGFLAAYAAASWVVIQVSIAVAPRVGLPGWVSTAVIVIAVAGLPVAAAVAVILRPHYAPTYVDEQVRHFREARSSILVSLHSLNPGSSDPFIAKWREALVQARLSGVSVAVLAPGGADRAEAAYELAKLHAIPLRLLDELEDQDLRFTLVDGDVVLISHQALGSKQMSRHFSVIESRRLHTVLAEYFSALWNDPDAKDFDAYLARLCSTMKAASDPASCKLLAQRLRIPAAVIDAAVVGQQAEA